MSAMSFDAVTPPDGATAPAVYDAEYYALHCGRVPYERNDYWLEQFGRIAEELIRAFAPRRVFDAGCAFGMLVEALWDRGVEAHGRDISEYAIGQARPDIARFCTVGSMTDEIEGEYDLVTCIEVLEHMTEEDSERAIGVICRAAPSVLFSSTPSDFDEPTHVNVRPPIHWLRRFAASGFAPHKTFDCSFVAPHAVLMQRATGAIDDDELLACANQILYRCALARSGESVASLRTYVKSLELHHEQLRNELAGRDELLERARADDEALRRSRSFRLATAIADTARRHPVAARLALRGARRALALRRSALGKVGASSPQSGAAEPVVTGKGAQNVLTQRYPTLTPLPVYLVPNSPRRVSVVTDSINSGSLFGGVGTALMLAAILARHLEAELRIITRTEEPVTDNVRRVLSGNGVLWADNIQFLFSFNGPSARPVDVGPNEIMITTSWWTTWATRASCPPESIVYLLQEDERRFYPDGDESLRCTEVFTDPRLHFVVNSKLLFDHLRKDPIVGSLCDRALWFEPAFPQLNYSWEERTADQRAEFFFYARPNNPRNLYARGLEAVSAAIESRVLSPDDWHFNFVGKDLQPLVLAGDVRPTLWQNLDWEDYAALVRRMDLGLSLMASPHPSYPPLDLAASGAVVVTNTFGEAKTSLERYSSNIIVAAPEIEPLVDAIARGAALAKDLPLRKRNWEASEIPRDWEVTLRPVVERLTDMLASKLVD